MCPRYHVEITPPVRLDMSVTVLRVRNKKEKKMPPDILGDIIDTLNAIEVRGKTNLALLYNAIDILTKLRNGDIQEEVPNESTDVASIT